MVDAGAACTTCKGLGHARIDLGAAIAVASRRANKLQLAVKGGELDPMSLLHQEREASVEP